MRSSPPRTLVLATLAIPHALLACQCAASFSVCNEVRHSDAVFIGTVESIEPNLIDRAARSQPASVFLHGGEKGPEESQPSLAELKKNYQDMFSDLPDIDKRRLQTANSALQLDNILDQVLSHGKRTRFRVKTLFRRADQDSDDDSKGSPGDQKSDSDRDALLEVWTDFGDCGFDFQKGETYLVYADEDEGTGRLETSSCTRTQRLSEAGEDLAYLFFYQNGGTESARLEGFATSELRQLNPDRFHYSGKTEHPVAHAVIELKSDGGARYTETNADGRFVFDGLAEGEYTVSAVDANPGSAGLPTGSRHLQVNAKSCATTNIFIPPASP